MAILSDCPLFDRARATGKTKTRILLVGKRGIKPWARVALEFRGKRP
jgi:hypothetical protein